MFNPLVWLEGKSRLACNLAVFYAGMIFLFSSIPVVPTPRGPPYLSYLLHFAEYLGFGFILLIAIKSRSYSGNALAFAVAVGVIYGLTDEMHQYFVPSRTADVVDFLFDSVGSAVGAFFSNLLSGR